MVLDCYRLAKYYGVTPMHFLALPVTEVMRHKIMTQKVIEESRQQDDD